MSENHVNYSVSYKLRSLCKSDKNEAVRTCYYRLKL